MVIQKDGNVGIGTTSPANKLTVLGVSGGTGFSGSDGTGGARVTWSTGYGVSLDAWDGGSPRWGITKFNAGTPTVMMEGQYSSTNVIFNAGNVGIGTTSPTALLHAQKTSANSALTVESVTSGTGKINLIGYNSSTSTVSADTEGAGVVLWNKDATANTFTRLVGLDAAGNYTNAIAFINAADATNEGEMAFLTRPASGNLTEQVRISDDGNVGIGTAAPDTLLHVLGGASGANIAKFERTSAADGHIAFNVAGGEPQMVFNTGAGAGTDQYALGYDTAGGFAIAESGVLGTNDRFYIKDGGNVGIGTTSPTATLHINGLAKASSAYPASSSGYLATTDYVQSRAENLVTNGAGLLNSNYNFSTYTFSAAETHGGGGSFLHSGAYVSKTTDELIPVDAEKYYRMVTWAKSGEAGGANYNSANKQYAGVVPHDIDGNQVTPFYYSKYSGSTDTTLAADLNTNATTVSVTDATGWKNDAGADYARNFVWYGYTNAKGYTYPNYTYSRLGSTNYSDFSTNGAWAAGGISGNTITLRAAWPGPTIPAGTAIRNNTSGGTYKYIALSNVTVPNAWTRYEGYIGGWDTTGSMGTNLFPYGTAYVKLLFLNNYAGGTTPTNNIRWSDVSLSESSARNLEGATVAAPGVITTSNQSLGAGDKYFSGNVGIGTTEPTSPLHVSKIDGYNSTSPVVTISNLDGSATEGNGLYVRAGASSVSSYIMNILDNPGNSVFYVRGDGNVGIGTTAPGAKLNVAGDVKLGDTANLRGLNLVQNYLSLGETENDASTILGNNIKATDGVNNTVQVSTNPNDGSNWIKLNYSTGMSFHRIAAAAVGTQYANTSGELMRITTAGNVGIGTTGPDDKLEVNGNIRLEGPSDVGLIFNPGAAAYTSSIYVRNEATTGAEAFRIFTRAASPGLADTLRMGITSAEATADVYFMNSNVGIGTTAPAQKLQVVGVAQADTAFYVGTGVGTVGGDDNLLRPTATSSWLNLKGGTGRAKISIGSDEMNIISGNSSGSIILRTNASSSTSTGTAVMTLTGSNVGIGTTVPERKLDVNGALAVQGNDDAIILHNSSDTTYGYVTLYGAGVGGVGIKSDANSGGNAFLLGSSNSGVVVNSAGNVGIGTATPIGALHVKGAAAASGTGTISSSGTTVTGVSTTFTTQLNVGDAIIASNQTRIVTAIASNTALTTDTAFSPVIAASTAFTYQRPVLRLADSTGAFPVTVHATGLASLDNSALGALLLPTDAGVVSWVDLPVTSAASNGTKESYAAQIDGTSVLTVYGESDGSGGTKNRRIEINNTAVFTSEYDNGNSGTAKTVDWNNGNKQKVTMTGNCTFTFTAPTGGVANVLFRLIQDATGGRTATWPSSVKWPGGSAPTLTAAANAVDIVTCFYNGTNYYCSSGLDFK